MKYPFEASFAEIQSSLDEYASTVLASLESEFLVLPRGQGFVEYGAFEQAYEFLKRATLGFQKTDPDTLLQAAIRVPMSVIIVRTILGFTPPEWAYLASRHTGVEVPQGMVRALDRSIRISPFKALSSNPVTNKRVSALMETAVFT